MFRNFLLAAYRSVLLIQKNDFKAHFRNASPNKVGPVGVRTVRPEWGIRPVRSISPEFVGPFGRPWFWIFLDGLDKNQEIYSTKHILDLTTQKFCNNIDGIKNLLPLAESESKA